MRILKKEEKQRKEEEKQRKLKQKEDEEQQRRSGQSADKDYKVIMTFKDGYSIVELLSGECKDLEGDEMQHCMNSGYGIARGADGEPYRNRRIFSVRDPNNKAHVTMEVDPRLSKILYIKGKQNKRPIEKYHSYVAAFINKSKFTIGKRLKQIYIG